MHFSSEKKTRGMEHTQHRSQNACSKLQGWRQIIDQFSNSNSLACDLSNKKLFHFKLKWFHRLWQWILHRIHPIQSYEIHKQFMLNGFFFWVHGSYSPEALMYTQDNQSKCTENARAGIMRVVQTFDWFSVWHWLIVAFTLMSFSLLLCHGKLAQSCLWVVRFKRTKCE